jgi:probable F420-dependent oxidoreductase
MFSFNTEYTLRADRIARALEERGFESFWLPEHTHIPIPENGFVRSPADGSELPVEYRHMSDPFCGLSAAAAVTTRLKLGTGICLINQHHPISLAKRVSTLDHLSDGRFIFGVGAGWNEGEMGHHGIQLKDRWKQTVERLTALKTLWRDEEPQFSGRFVKFDKLWLYPKPVQKPHPEIVLGTLDTPFARGVVAKYADGWLPLTFDVARTKQSIDDVRARMRALGRDDAKLSVSLFFLEDKEQPLDVLKAARDTGVERAILRLPIADEKTVLKSIDLYARSIA